MHQPVPQLVINLYHKQVHRPCTNLYQTTCTINKCINHAPTCTSTCTMHQTCTNNMSQQPVQTTYHNNLSHQSYQPNQTNHQDNSQRCASTKHSTTTHNHHQDQYVFLIIYQYKYATSSINHVSTILLTSASNHISSMYQSCINYSSRCTNIINYTPHVCVNSSTTCLNHVPNMYLNQNLSSISSSKSYL
jgi:hypothetical protein